jgi:hypothetical protein
MNWNDITVGCYQAIYPIINDQSLTEIERDSQILSIIMGIPESEIDSWPIDEFLKHSKSLDFLHAGEMKTTPVQYIQTKTGMYKLNYNVKRIPLARYAEIKHFTGQEKDIIRILHTVLASMVIPMRKQRWNIFGKTGWKELPYESQKHEQYANDLKSAKFQDAFYALVFFCNLYANWMRNSQGYLVRNLTATKKVTPEQASKQVQDLCSVMDGFITQNKLPNIRA